MTFTPRTKPHAIVTCCTPDWLPLAACTLKSCQDQGAAALADFYVLGLGFSAKDRADFAAFQARHGMTAHLIEGSLPEAVIARAPKRFSAAAYLRLVLDQILDPSYERVLYLDSDILALAPMAQVLTYELGGLPLGAVEDWQSFPTRLGGHARHPASIGLPAGSRYFNSGVLLFDWPKILNQRLLPECLARIMALSTARKKLNFPDQDVMNLVFAGKWQRMPTRFNLISVVSDFFPEAPVLRHFTKDHKPWHRVKGLGYEAYHALYQSMLDGTPWAGFTERGRSKFAALDALGNYLRRRNRKARARYERHLAG